MPDLKPYVRAFATAGPRRLSFSASKAVHQDGRRVLPFNVMEANVEKSVLGAAFQECALTGVARGLMEEAIVESIRTAGDVIFQLHAPEAAVGDLGGAVTFVGKFDQFQWGDPWGEVRKWETSVKTNDGVLSVHGKPMWNTVLAGARISATGASTPIQLPAIPAGYLGRFVFCVPDPDATAGTAPLLDGKLQSAAASAFSSGVVDRGTLSQISSTLNAARCQMFTIDGDTTPVTDTWWRFNVTALGGTSPAFHVIAMGGVTPKIANS